MIRFKQLIVNLWPSTFNKMDVLRQINKWTLIHKGKKVTFDTEDKMKEWIVQKANLLPYIPNVYFSGDPNGL